MHDGCEEIRQQEYTKAHIRPGAALETMAEATGGAYVPVFGPEKWRPKRVDALAMRVFREREGGEPFKPARVDEAAFGKWVGRMLAAYVDGLHAEYVLGTRAPTTSRYLPDPRDLPI